MTNALDRRRSPGDDQAVILSDLGMLVAALDRNMSAYVAAHKAEAINNVLDVEYVTLPASGTFERSFSVPFAAVAVSNLGAGTVVLSSDPVGVAAPSGPGSHPIGAGSGVVLNITGRVVSLYGAAGSVVGLQVFERPQPPGFGGSTSAPGGLAAVIALADGTNPTQKATVNAFGALIVAQSTTRLAELSTLLGAAGTRTGTTFGTTGYAKFRAFAAADVAGTLSIQQSRDNATWYTTTSAPVAAGITQGTVLESIIVLSFARAQYVNGAGAQAAFEFDAGLVAI